MVLFWYPSSVSVFWHLSWRMDVILHQYRLTNAIFQYTNMHNIGAVGKPPSNQALYLIWFYPINSSIAMPALSTIWFLQTSTTAFHTVSGLIKRCSILVSIVYSRCSVESDQISAIKSVFFLNFFGLRFCSKVHRPLALPLPNRDVAARKSRVECALLLFTPKYTWWITIVLPAIWFQLDLSDFVFVPMWRYFTGT